MHQDSPERLRRMNYYNWVQDFINYALSNLRNISGNSIKCPYKRCKNKKVYLNIVTIHLQQERFIEKYLCWFAYREPHVSYKTMIEKIIGSTFSSSSVYRVEDDNHNPYSNIIMDVKESWL